ncbi:voltage-gated potassium channel subunit beta-2 isoform X3 [Dendroctonus ponderosae]|uniref:NADP-dependent oxidoreductase domain-containing protein n=1 Tax=Dendroctonus ponderosae TaxID=77166 RepID=A0AAR5PYT0_DENPD|nr:voltage-gated potassium channel subunit beta-2 isoform X3 [Dendroctonus ponderosae]XP_019766159.1 voltage-gated potassium channel subunit beta-2 isoform X3 [Dendroctonus ponderosae]XP_019766160.1 voltage-gated potassium channel subunit beta-2 isoform X3 [Dendroctonus ponderosae]
MIMSQVTLCNYSSNDNNNNDNVSEDSHPPTIYRCRAPIASLDCMEEFSAGSGLSGLADRAADGGGLTKEQLLLAGLTHSAPTAPLQLNRTANVTPGLRYRNLGKSGLRVSNIGLGTWPTFSPNVTEEQAEQIIVLAVESGINAFDLSEAHSGTRAEVELGRILTRRGWKRTTFIVTTKIYWSTRSEERGLSRKHIIESVKASLSRLQLSYIDVVIVHKADPMCPMEEVVRAMNYVINQGWVMYWGTARWSPVEIMEAYTNCRQFNCVTPIVEQAEYHLFCREKTELHMPELYNKIGVGLMAWSPISMGLSQSKDDSTIQLFSRASFRNKYSSFSWTEDETAAANKEVSQSKPIECNHPNVLHCVTLQGYGWMKERSQPAEESRKYSERIRELNSLAERLGCSLAQLTIAWTLKNESVQCLLLGASNVDQLYESIQALQLIPKLNVSMVQDIEKILENKPTRPPMVSTLALR